MDNSPFIVVRNLHVNDIKGSVIGTPTEIQKDNSDNDKTSNNNTADDNENK